LSLLISAFVLLRREFVSESNNFLPIESNKVNMIRDAIEYIRENFTKKIVIDELASHLHFSKGYLSHTFKKVTGCSIIEFLNLVRCQNARVLLLDNYSVSEAALSSGFTEFSYFTRVFKKTMGVLPSNANKEVFTIYNHGELN
ncbi:MAG: helix-turn-helix transcriptional regulator, partial [Clostridia bacterium]|nr:helix-turn-helix transcriptional regulator [Clostridia bacterium]